MTQSQAGRPRQQPGSARQSQAQSKPKSQSQTTGRRYPTGRANRPMSSDQKFLHATLQFQNRCIALFKRLPIVWQIVVAGALVVGGILAAPYVLSFIADLLMNLCILGFLLLFLICMVGSMFGGGGGRKKNDDDEWWDEMMDPRGNGPRHHAPDYF